MARQSVQSKKRDEEEDEHDEDEDEEERDDEEEEDEDGPESKDSDDDSDEDEDDEEGDDLDSALADRGKKPSIFIEPWRKKGSITVWIHPKTKFAKVGHHKWYRIVQFTKNNGDEVSFIRFERFNCHEPADYVSISKDRDDNLRRDHRAQVCPFCKMIEWVEEQVISGKIEPDAEIFRFDDGDPEHLQVLHAAGISGLIGLENAPERWKKICKRSKVLQKDPWSENCGLKLSHAFQVVADNDPSEVKWALEPPDLFFNLKDAIAKEKKRNGDDDGDPRKNPYALLWEFDEAKARKDYGRGSSVIPQPKRNMTGKIKRLLNGPKRTDQMDVIGPGNCLELRAAMENSIADGIDMPFDEIFAAAKKAGLMKPSEKSQSTQPKERKRDEEDEPESDPKPKTAYKADVAQAKGNSEKKEPESTCDICHEAIGEDDIECKSCATTFDPESNYEIDGIKCTECGTVVPLNNPSEAGDDTLHICEKCGTIHRLAPSVRMFYDTHREAAKKGKRCDLKFAWKVEPKEESKKESTSDKPKRGEGRGRGKTSTDSEKLDKKLKGDKFNF